jgi:hypothetical protein
VVPDERSLTLPDPASPDDRWLSTTRVAWLGDRFVLVDEDADAVNTSIDGRAWDVLDASHPDRDYYQALTRRSTASWQDQMVGWIETPGFGVLHIVRPPSEPITTPDFDGRVAAVEIGPAGLVAVVRSDFDLDGFGWYSPDGDRWSRIPAFPPNVGVVVGVSGGFIACGDGEPCDGCVSAGMWHSASGPVRPRS